MHQQSLYKSLLKRKVLFGATLGSAVIFMIIGVMLWGGFNWGMEVTNTEKFCISCHEMEDNVYAEYSGTAHDANRSGVKASCPDCHVPKPWIHKIVRKIKASNEVYHKLLGTVDSPEKFNEHRLTMARRVWGAMKTTDSRECRNCHDWETMNPEKQKPRARKQHIFAMENGNTCIDCHKGIAHTAVHTDIPDEELEEWAKPIESYITEIPESFKAGLERIAITDAAAKTKQLEDTKKAREARKAEAIAEQEKIDAAVAAAVANITSKNDAEQKTNESVISPQSQGFGVDWNSSPEREITLLYPGQASMEWTLVGKYHGGARPLQAGDRCVECHDQETADMGQKIVTGEKAETTPIEGKRGSIPVTVQAAHDDSNLYMRFQWEETEHAPVPFVDGGKMDPENAVKLAVMFATDEVEYAAQGGCWATCHHDAREMPNHPEDPTIANLELDLSQGITKYLKESRTKVEEKGRRGAKLGGWDKLKTSDALKAEMDAGHYMDLMRWSSNGTVENGHILEQRILAKDDSTEAQGWKENGLWTVVFKRPLKTDNSGDVSIDTGTLYNFGFAIHDDYSNARFHHVSLGYKLALDDDSAEINATKTTVTTPTVQTQQQTPSGEVSVVATTEVSANAVVDKGIDWSKSGEREITLFYPGQTSMEWVLVGKHHGGARPVQAGDRCVECHDQETADMGQKIVSGEKAEPTPIEGKRGSIPVTVQATHDTENLYMRFLWEGTSHVPVPFVDGGKMDPENAVKLALMFATDDVEYASQAGCWSTCHHDAREMPNHPEDPAAANLELDISQGITKYLKESRTKVEEKGRRGAKLGGWDTLKASEDLQVEMKAKHYMDILRVNSGNNNSEDGHILEQRYMSGGQGFESSVTEEAGFWTVTMKRKLQSDNDGDVSLDTETLYNFGFAIHDDYSNARFHHVSLGYKLGFDNADAEINVTQQ